MSQTQSHPAWCLREGCADRGYHASAETRCNADPSWDSIEFYVTADDDRQAAVVEMAIVRTLLTQDLDRGATRPPANLEIAFWDVPEDRNGILLTPHQARLVVAGLTEQLHALEGDHA